MLDPQGTVLLDQPDEGSPGRPEVLRGDLRRILLDSLPDDAVQWGRKVTGVRPLGDGRHELTFADGSVVTTGLLVGADGAWSKIRPLLSDATPEYVGTTFVETYLYDADERHPATATAVGGGAMYALTPGKGIVAHREAGDILHTYVELNRPAEWIAGIDFTDAAAATARVAAEFGGWAPALTALITDGETAPVPRMIHTLPDGHRWDRVPGVTLLGDAAHLMPPSGDGANLAMFDGAELGQAIVAHPDDIEAALAAYEGAMFPRSESFAADAREILELCLGDRAPFGLIEFPHRRPRGGGRRDAAGGPKPECRVATFTGRRSQSHAREPPRRRAAQPARRPPHPRLGPPRPAGPGELHPDQPRLRARDAHPGKAPRQAARPEHLTRPQLDAAAGRHG